MKLTDCADNFGLQKTVGVYSAQKQGVALSELCFLTVPKLWHNLTACMTSFFR